MIKPFLALAAIAIAAVSTGALAQISEEDRLQRCANNQTRVDVLDSQILADEDFMGNAETQRTLDDRNLAIRYRDAQGLPATAADAEAGLQGAMIRFGVNRSCVLSYNCMDGVVERLSKQLTRGALARKRLAPQIEELKLHRTNLTALHCNEPAAQVTASAPPSGASTGVFATGALGQMSEQDRLQRCANNDARAVELHSQIRADPDFMTDAEMQKTRDDFDHASYPYGSNAAGFERLVEDAVQRFGVNRSCVLSSACMNGVLLRLDERLKRGALARKRLASQIEEFERHRTNLTALRCDEPPTQETASVFAPQSATGPSNGDAASVDFAGTFTNSGNSSTITISGSGGSFTAHEVWATGGRNGDNTWSNCQPAGNTLKCDWTGEYLGDPDKTAHRGGTLSVTLDGNSLHGAYYEHEPKFSWNVAPYPSAMHEGAQWPINLVRQGGN